jgi:hypothetical protein
MPRHRLPLLPLLVGVLFAMGCTASPAPSASPGAPSSSGSAGSPTVGAPPTVEPTGDGIEYRVTYPFAVPSTPVSIANPSATPTFAYLVGIYVGNHPEGTPAYQRISFYFRDGFPSYTFQYVPQVISDGQGAPVSLPGNAFLSIVFVDARAHDDTGRPTLLESPPATIGFANLKGYAFAGDFEARVSYGLGIQVAPNSGQALPIRSGELKRPDGASSFFYVVHFDVQAG